VNYSKIPVGFKNGYNLRDLPTSPPERAKEQSNGAMPVAKSSGMSGKAETGTARNEQVVSGSQPVRVAQAGDAGMDDGFWIKALVTAGLAIYEGNKLIMTGSVEAVDALYRHMTKTNQDTAKTQQVLKSQSDGNSEKEEEKRKGQGKNKAEDKNKQINQQKKPNPSDNIDPGKDIEEQLKGQGQLRDLRNNPNWKEKIGIQDALKRKYSELKEMVKNGELSKKGLRQIEKAFEGRDLGKRGGKKK
jgi:hypothetical protein